MAGTKEKTDTSDRQWKPITGDPQLRIISEDGVMRNSGMKPIEVKVNAKKDAKPLNISEYEQGTSGR